MKHPKKKDVDVQIFDPAKAVKELIIDKAIDFGKGVIENIDVDEEQKKIDTYIESKNRRTLKDVEKTLDKHIKKRSNNFKFLGGKVIIDSKSIAKVDLYTQRIVDKKYIKSVFNFGEVYLDETNRKKLLESPPLEINYDFG